MNFFSSFSDYSSVVSWTDSLIDEIGVDVFETFWSYYKYAVDKRYFPRRRRSFHLKTSYDKDFFRLLFSLSVYKKDVFNVLNNPFHYHDFILDYNVDIPYNEIMEVFLYDKP